MHQDEQALILDSAAATPGPWTRALLRCGLAAGPVFVATLFLAGAAGLWRSGPPGASTLLPPVLIGAAGAGLISAAVFATDPVSGYPPGTPAVPSRPTRTGMAHILSGAGFGQSPRLVTVAGLLQRISIITGFTWMTTLAAQALRRPAVASAGPRPAGPRRWTRQC